MSKVALITGITGQDSSYLAEFLLAKGYNVHGIVRRSSWPNTGRIDHIFNPDSAAQIHYADLETGIAPILYEIKPDEVYNIGAMSHVKISFEVPEYTLNTNAVAVTRILEEIRLGIKYGILHNDIKFYQASSSEMFGTTPPPQNETTSFNPASAYGAAKLAAFFETRRYRVGYKMFACTGILFNHESSRRGVNFVTRKITRALARIKLGKQETLCLGNLDAKRDWGHAKDYVEAIYLIMQHRVPDEFVVATGFQHSVRDFIDEVSNILDFDLWKYIQIDDRLKRPVEVPSLLGDATKIRSVLGWEPKISFKQLVKEMVEYDLTEEAKHD